jgi:mannose-1-phosphate guanylyltransferase
MFPDLHDAGCSTSGRISNTFVTQPGGSEEYQNLARTTTRWGVILSGGYGTHLLGLTRLIVGDDRPKQFCPLFGGSTLLEKMRQRAARSISAERILFPLLRAHRPFFLQEPGIRPSQRIVQPLDRGTAPAIAHSILSIHHRDKNALVAILPCDHYYPGESAFTAALETAFDVAARHPASVVLLGVTPPRDTQTVHGWIELGQPVNPSGDTFQVRSFCDRPSPRFAKQLIDRGALWNTLVMVGHVDAFLNMINASRAGLANAFHGGCLWAGEEVNIAEPCYQRIYAVDFSRDVLSIQAPNLLTLRAGLPGWNDLREPQSLIDILEGANTSLPWMKEWRVTGQILARAAAQFEPLEPRK